MPNKRQRIVPEIKDGSFVSSLMENIKCTPISEKSLTLYGSLLLRLNRNLDHLPRPTNEKELICKLNW